MFLYERESSLLAATVLYPLLGVTWKTEIAGNYNIMCVYLVS